jgi:hypothetical protein
MSKYPDSDWIDDAEGIMGGQDSVPSSP